MARKPNLEKHTKTLKSMVRDAKKMITALEKIANLEISATVSASPKRKGKAKKAEAAPKRRGRPPKNKTVEAAAPKRRGRPPKNKVEEVAAQPKKRRGRPPKNVSATATA